MGKKDLLQKEMGSGTMAVMHMIKQGFDPHGILNPGKILHGKGDSGKSGFCS